MSSQHPNAVTSQSEPNNALLLVSLLQAHRVSPEELTRRYPAVIAMLKKPIIVVPNAPCYLEVWPPAFESHNMVFIHFLNTPAMQMGRAAPREVVFLACHATARFDSCPYIAAHSMIACAKSGVSKEKIANLMQHHQQPELFTPREQAMLGMVQALAKPQPTLTKEQKQNMLKFFPPRHTEWLAATTFLIGYLGKFMDAIAVEMEQPVAEIALGALAETGWHPGNHGWKLAQETAVRPYPHKDTALSALSLLRYVPGNALYVRRAMRGIPSGRKQLQRLLQARLGHSFPFLSRFLNRRLHRATAQLLLCNLDPNTSVSGLYAKCFIGMSFAVWVKNPTIELAIRDLAVKFGVTEEELTFAAEFANTSSLNCEHITNKQVHAMAMLAKSLFPTPCNVTKEVVAHLRRVDVAPSVIVELVMWVALLQTLNRITYYLEL